MPTHWVSHYPKRRAVLLQSRIPDSVIQQGSKEPGYGSIRNDIIMMTQTGKIVFRRKRKKGKRAENLVLIASHITESATTMDRQQYGSFQSSSTVVAEGVYQFIRGSMFGAIWGAVTPFPDLTLAGASSVSSSASASAAGSFRPAPIFASPKSIPHYAVTFGSVLAVQRMTSKFTEQIRRKDDWANELVGYGVAYRYYMAFLAHSQRRLLMHNRVVGGVMAVSVLYANFLA